MPSQRIPILVYHHVYENEVMAGLEPSAGIIGRRDFLRQMNHIAENDWIIVSTTQIIDWLLDSAPLPSRALALHFDNGWLDTYTIALPILRDLGFKAMCYPITDGIEAASSGKVHTVRTLTEGVIENPFMRWEHVQELLGAGWEIGAHTASHCKMADKYESYGDKGILWEVNTSNDLFQKHLGFVPSHFAYPSGSRNTRTDELLAPLYRSLRLWHDDFPIVWTITEPGTSRLAIECQNIDIRVPFDDFQRIFTEALEA